MKLVTSLLGLALASSFALTSAAHAEDKAACAIKYTRTACAGQETESYKKCDGKASCVKQEAATSADQCKAAAVAACSNDRLTVTASKVINASYEGKPLKSASGKDDFCADYPKRAQEYDQCTKK